MGSNTDRSVPDLVSGPEPQVFASSQTDEREIVRTSFEEQIACMNLNLLNVDVNYMAALPHHIISG